MLKYQVLRQTGVAITTPGLFFLELNFKFPIAVVVHVMNL